MPLITGSRPDPREAPEVCRHVGLCVEDCFRVLRYRGPAFTALCCRLSPFLSFGGRWRGLGSRSEGVLRSLSRTWNGRQLKFLYPLMYLWIRSENKQKIFEKLKSQRVLPERPQEIVEENGGKTVKMKKLWKNPLVQRLYELTPQEDLQKRIDQKFQVKPLKVPSIR